MEPPTTTAGVLACGLGIAAVGTAAGAWIGSRLSPPDPAGTTPVVSNKTIGAGQGGLIGLLAAGLASTLYGQLKPGWRSSAAVVDVLGSAVVLLGVSSVVLTPRLASGVAPASQLTPPGKIVNVTPMDTGKTVNVSVGDTIYITLPTLPATGEGWSYRGAVAGLTYNGRSLNPHVHSAHRDRFMGGGR